MISSVYRRIGHARTRGWPSLVLLGSLLVAGCGPEHTAPPPRPAPDLRTIVMDGTARRNIVDFRQEASVGELRLFADPPEVWAALHSAFDELGIEVTTADIDAGVMGNRGYPARNVEGRRMSNYFDCGSGLATQLGGNNVLMLGVLVHVRAEPKGVTVMRTTLDAFMHDRAVSGPATHCVSRGRLEQRIAELVKEQVEG